MIVKSYYSNYRDIGYLPAEVLEVYHSVVEMILLRRSLKIAEKLQDLQEVLK